MLASLSTTKSAPNRNPSFFNAYYDVEAPQKKYSPVENPFAAACEIVAFIVKTRIGLGQDLTIIGV
jgi:hypothetical protein